MHLYIPHSSTIIHHIIYFNSRCTILPSSRPFPHSSAIIHISFQFTNVCLEDKSVTSCPVKCFGCTFRSRYNAPFSTCWGTPHQQYRPKMIRSRYYDSGVVLHQRLGILNSHPYILSRPEQNLKMSNTP